MNPNHFLNIFDKRSHLLGRRLPALELVHGHFVRHARFALSSIVGKSVDVEPAYALVRSYREFLADVSDQASFALVGINDSRELASWSMSPELLYLAVDLIFGGRGDTPSAQAGDCLSVTGRRVARRLLEPLLEEYERAWSVLGDLSFTLQHQEAGLAAARVAHPDDEVLHCRFNVTILQTTGAIDLCIPYWMLAPFHERLCSSEIKIKRQNDLHWANQIEASVQDAEVFAVAILAKQQMTIRQVLGLSIGDILPIDILDPVPIVVDDQPMYRGRYGVKNGKYAVRIDGGNPEAGPDHDPTEADDPVSTIDSPAAKDIMGMIGKVSLDLSETDTGEVHG